MNLNITMTIAEKTLSPNNELVLDAIASQRLQDSPSPRRSLLTKVTEIEWSRHFPFSLTNDEVNIKYVSPEVAFYFIKEHYNEITEQQTDAKLQYYKECGDFFMFYKDSLPIGLFIGNLTDWSTYYFRSVGILPQYQGNGAFPRLLSYLTKILSDSGIARIESDTSVSNFTSIQILLRARFKVTGMQLSERWGALLHFTKFLSAPSEKIFMDQYCHGIRTQ
jgi:GNAT superfamily N-acetyltransferase